MDIPKNLLVVLVSLTLINFTHCQSGLSSLLGNSKSGKSLIIIHVRVNKISVLLIVANLILPENIFFFFFFISFVIFIRAVFIRFKSTYIKRQNYNFRSTTIVFKLMLKVKQLNVNIRNTNFYICYQTEPKTKVFI